MSVKNVISWHSAFTCSFGTLSPGLKSYLVHQVVKWEKSTPITPWWPTLKTKNKVIFWISLRILHQISVTAKNWLHALTQICLNTNKFLDRVSGFPDPESVFFRRNLAKIVKKSGLTVYHDVIHQFSYSNHGKFKAARG